MTSRSNLACWILTGVAGAAPACASELDCLPATRTQVMLSIDPDAPPRLLQLVGGQSPPLELIDPLTGSALWSADAAAPAAQIFPSMWAGFSGSLTAVDLDADGTHDRIYAGDLAGRLWRFDIHHGAGTARLLTGGIFAALGGGPPATRAFVAPADVSLGGPATTPWLNVAIGSASIVSGAGHNRFYVLRDRAAFESWSQQQYLDWRPLGEPDLLWRNDPAAAERSAADGNSPGFYVTLAAGSVLASSITVSGRATVAVARDVTGTGATCTAAVTISSLWLDADQEQGDDDRRERAEVATMALPERIAVSAQFQVDAASGLAEASCRFGTTRIDDCSVPMPLSPVWWRREDAD